MTGTLPIAFSDPLVRALLARTKTQTRRTHDKLRYGVGDLLWVREAFAFDAYCDEKKPSEVNEGATVWYRASWTAAKDDIDAARGRWRPPMYMPRWASRITLRVTAARMERLQEITADDVVDEGFSPSEVPGIGSDSSFIKAFAATWDSLHAKNPERQWKENPVVCVYTFEVVT